MKFPRNTSQLVISSCTPEWPEIVSIKCCALERCFTLRHDTVIAICIHCILIMPSICAALWRVPPRQVHSIRERDSTIHAWLGVTAKKWRCLFIMNLSSCLNRQYPHRRSRLDNSGRTAFARPTGPAGRLRLRTAPALLPRPDNRSNGPLRASFAAAPRSARDPWLDRRDPAADTFGCGWNEVIW